MMQSVLTLGQVSQVVECILKDHNEKTQQNKIMEICMKQGCTQSKILCPLCKNLHNDHREQLVSIAEIEDEFKNFQQVSQNKILLFINEFESFATKIIRESIIMKNEQPSYYELNEQVSELVKLIEFDNFKVKFKQLNPQEIDIQINNLANQYLLDIKTFVQQDGISGQLLQQSSTKPNNILNIQNQQEQQQNNVVNGVQGPKINDLHFLQQDCGINIKCVTPKCVKNISSQFSNKQRDYLAFLNRNLQQSEGASLVFKIKKIIYRIGIGICQMEKESSKPFLYSENIGSGIYLAYSDEFIYNSDYENYNDKQVKHFKIVEGEKYRFTFDPANEENKQFALEQVENSANKITMPMKIDYTQNYHIFVYLSGNGSEIELINE